MKDEKGSITLFTLIAMIFLLTIAFTAYTSTMIKLQSQNTELDQIIANYSKDANAENLEKLYNEATGTRNWLQGEGTEQNPHKIYTIEDLVELSNRTNSGESFANQYIELMNDLDFNDVRSYEKYDRKDFGDINENGTVESLKTELTTGAGFMPIGKTNALVLKATFDGNNHTIKHLKVDRNMNFASLIGNSYVVQNLTVKDGDVKGGTCTSGIVGALRSGKVENCHNDNTAVVLRDGSYFSVAGVVGQISQGSIGAFNCTNSGTITGIGGNKGDGTSYLQIGGVAGRNNGIVNNCSNTGEVIGIGGYHIGGVVGSSSNNITNCTNSGTVRGEKLNVGGVSGYVNSNSTVSNCRNTGEIIGSDEMVGGIVGRTDQNVTITGCSNTGAVTGAERTGGVTGNGSTSSIVTSCSNTGAVTGTSSTGGVVGILFGTVEQCYNTGTVTQNAGKGDFGGVVGQIGTNCVAKIQNCYNTGKLIEQASNINGVGGVIGWVSDTGTTGQINNNYSIGEIDIQGSNVTNVGGAIGRFNTSAITMSNNYYELGKSNVTLNSLGEGREQANMKTTAFINLLNTNQNPTVWQSDTTSINNGYPILKWQINH